MKTNINFYRISLNSSQNEKCFRQTLQRKSKHTFHVQYIYIFLNRALCEILQKNIVEPSKPHITIWRVRIVYWIPKTTNTDSECSLLALSLQQRQHELLRYTHISCLVLFLFQIRFYIPSILFLSGGWSKILPFIFSLLFLLYDPSTSPTKLLVKQFFTAFFFACCVSCPNILQTTTFFFLFCTIEIFSPKINIIFTDIATRLQCCWTTNVIYAFNFLWHDVEIESKSGDNSITTEFYFIIKMCEFGV